MIDGLPGFESATVIRRLGAGPVADSWLMAFEGAEVVLRKDRSCAARLGLDRAREFRVLEAAHGRGLGPEPLAADPERGLLLTRYLAGTTWVTRRETGGVTPWDRLGALLRRVHALAPTSVPRFDPVAIVQRYARVAATPEAQVLAAEAAALAERLYRGAPWVLCHHDPHLGNVVGEPGVLIDWEYAALGHPLFDLAVTIDHHDLDRRAMDALLTAWAGSAPRVTLEALDEFLELVSRVNALWSLAIRRAAE